MIYISVTSEIPNIISEKKDLLEEYGTLSQVFKEECQYRKPKSFVHVTRERLILVTSDREEKKYILTDRLNGHWNEFLKESNIGKELRVYLGTDRSRTNPLIVELEKKRIYGKSTGQHYSIFIIFLTVLITTYTIYQIFEEPLN